PAVGKTGGARNDCAECHKYHGGDANLHLPPSSPASAVQTRERGVPASITPATLLQIPIRLVSLAAPQKFVGAWSCASAGCHGDVRRGGPEWRSAFTTWATIDPHAQAFEVLWTFRGREMTRLLDGRPKSGAESMEK